MRSLTIKSKAALIEIPVLIDLKKPDCGGSSYALAYVQLSRATELEHIFIMRPFDGDDLRAPLPQALEQELAWQEDMATFTSERYSDLGALK